MLTVYKASAGSGKTFQLVAEYLQLLLENPFNYKHILAVTFTNKATNEMKSRILEQLYTLAANQASDYLEIIQKENNLPEEIIRKKAKWVLKNILHDYNRFSVNTIDSFTQRVIKAFNRELGISPNFAIELDSSMVLEEAVDNLLANIDKDKNLRKWLIDFSKEKITENRSQRIEDDIKQLGKELFNERFQVFFPENDKTVYTRENLNLFRKELNSIIAVFEGALKKYGKKGISIISENGFTIDDFSYKLNGVAGFFKKYSDGKLDAPGKRVLEAAESSEKWFAKKHSEKDKLLVLVESQLQPLLNEVLTFFENKSQEYFSAEAVKSKLRMLGILTDLKEEIKKLLQEKGQLQISDSNLLLSKIIGQSDSPFVYEKIGNHFKYFMLDEFQDTSGLQWNNFKPLIENSLSEGHKNLLVGDVKQSIYRWRNSDWNILAEQVDNAFPNFIPNKKTLDKNWRSDKNIIDFNNAVINALKENFNRSLFTEDDSPEWMNFKAKFNNVYNDIEQQPGNEEAEKTGLVKINFLEKEDFELNSIQLLIEQVKLLQEKGIKAKEIAILIRKNKDGAKIIEAFLAASKVEVNNKFNLSVLSNESLFLHASKAVLFVIYIIEILIDPVNTIVKAAAANLWFQSIKPELNNLGFSISETHKKQRELVFHEKNTEDWQLAKDFESEFDNELGQPMEELKQRVMFTSLDESISEVCSIFKLFKINAEIPFLQTLIDKAGEIKSSLSNDLSNFLFWWNEKGNKTSVNVNEEVDSIRMLTVHKSKGLEYKAVLIPDLNWPTSWSGSLAPTLWCSSEIEPFNRLPLFPVKAEKKLESTYFKTTYFEEKASYLIDTLNLLYVAFTRAKSALFIHAEDSKKEGNSINSQLKSALQQMNDKSTFENCWNNNDNSFEFGDLLLSDENLTVTNSETVKNYQYNNFTNRVKLRLNGENFLVQDENKKSVKNTGNLIHEILSEIKTFSDVDKACLKAFNEGKLDENEIVEIKELLQQKMSNTLVTDWFNGSMKVINERNLLRSDKLLRPDRILVSGKNAIVIDYKTGEKKSDNYKRQVDVYAKTLKETGFENVRGYLWYINQNEVEKVCEY